MKKKRTILLTITFSAFFGAAYLWTGLVKTTPERDEAALAEGLALEGYPASRLVRSAFARLRCQAAVSDAINNYSPGISGWEEEKRISGFINVWADEDLGSLCRWMEGAMASLAVDGWTAVAVERTGERFPHLAYATGIDILRRRGVEAIRPDELVGIATRLDAESLISLMEIAVPAGAEREHVADYAKDFDFDAVGARCMSETDARGWLDYLPGNFVEEWAKRKPWKVLAFQNERIDRGLMTSGDNGMGDFLESFTAVVSREDAIRVMAGVLERPRTAFEMGELGRFFRYEGDRELLEISFGMLNSVRGEEAATELLRRVIRVDAWRQGALTLFPSPEARIRGVAAISISNQRIFLALDKELRALGHSEDEIERALTIPAS